MLSYLFFFFLLVKSTESKIIKHDFFYCNKTREILNINISCENQWDCSNFNNIKNVLTENVDKFTYLSLLNETRIVYLNNEIFNTHCSKVNTIEIVEKVDRCTNDLFVKFTHNNFRKSGFLTREKIIRNSSFPVQCTFRRKFFTRIDTDINIYTENKQVKIETVKLQKLELFFGKEDKKNNFSLLQTLLKAYDTNIHENEAFQISEDGIIIIMIILILYSNRQKLNLTVFSKLYEKLNKTRKDIKESDHSDSIILLENQSQENNIGNQAFRSELFVENEINSPKASESTNATSQQRTKRVSSVRVGFEEDDFNSPKTSKSTNATSQQRPKRVSSVGDRSEEAGFNSPRTSDSTNATSQQRPMRVSCEKPIFLCPKCQATYIYKKRFEDHLKICK